MCALHHGEEEEEEEEGARETDSRITAEASLVKGPVHPNYKKKKTFTFISFTT